MSDIRKFITPAMSTTALSKQSARSSGGIETESSTIAKTSPQKALPFKRQRFVALCDDSSSDSDENNNAKLTIKAEPSAPAYEGVWKSLFDNTGAIEDDSDVDDSGDDQSDFVFISEMPRKRGRHRTLANLAKVDAMLTKKDPITNAPIRTTPARIIMVDPAGEGYDPVAAKEFFSLLEKHKIALQSKEEKITRNDGNTINKGDAGDLLEGLEARKQAALREWADRVERKHGLA